jgi:O-antigen/teichoic acid export membrane protein
MIKKLKSKGNLHSEKIKYLPSHLTSYLGGMFFIAIISSINFQADKLITSSMFDLNIFGFYNLASSLSQIPVILAMPLMLFVFPLFSKFANHKSESSNDSLNVTFIKSYYLINIVSSGVAVVIFLYADEILILWTKNIIPISILHDIVFDLKMLIIGSFFLAIQFPLYYLLLSKGKTKYTIIQGIVQIGIGVPLLYFCSKNFGIKGVPISWVFINLLSLLYLMIIVFRRYIVLPFGKFQLKTFVIPLASITFVNIIFYYIFLLNGSFFLLFATTGFILSIIFSIVCINYFNNMPILSVKHFYNFPNDEM